MNKLIIDNKVAVLVSPGYGAGWSTWSNLDPFDPVLAKMLNEGASKDELRKEAEKRYPGEYLGGIDELEIHWVPRGTRFRIEEYDGAECIVIYNSNSYYEA